MKHTHTNTPWHVGKRAADIAIYGQKGEEIAKILGFFNSDDENKANARLIASAPDLLAACKAALALMQEPDADEHFDAIKLEYMLEDAISKAEGGVA
jgi:hypothetical protein